MKKVFFIVVILFLFVFPLLPANNSVSGDWLLVKAEVNGKISKPYMMVGFSKEGKVILMGREFGKWRISSDEESIIIESRFAKGLNGVNKIVKIDNKFMILENKRGKYTYLRIKRGEFADENKKSGLAGLWKIDGGDFTKYLKLDLPFDVKLVKFEDGAITELSGEWFYDSKNKSLFLTLISTPLKGKLSIKNIDTNVFTFEKNGQSFKALRRKSEKDSLLKIDFKYEDFDEDADYHDKLPWNDYERMIDFLKGIKNLRYRRGIFVKSIGIFKYSPFISRVKVLSDKKRIVFTNFNIIDGKEEQFSQRYKDDLSERYNYFFPLKELFPYRIKGKEKIKVKAGEFMCTVVEGFDGDNKVVYWMIDSMPGVYAKVAELRSDSSGKSSYVVKELVEVE